MSAAYRKIFHDGEHYNLEFAYHARVQRHGGLLFDAWKAPSHRFAEAMAKARKNAEEREWMGELCRENRQKVLAHNAKVSP